MSGINYFCERREYVFIALPEYSIIILQVDIFMASICLIILIERKKLKFGKLANCKLHVG